MKNPKAWRHGETSGKGAASIGLIALAAGSVVVFWLGTASASHLITPKGGAVQVRGPLPYQMVVPPPPRPTDRLQQILKPMPTLRLGPTLPDPPPIPPLKQYPLPAEITAPATPLPESARPAR